jgi:hypothetical protein
LRAAPGLIKILDEVPMPTRTIRPGDSLSSIAVDHGLPPEKIWDHPNNAELKLRRSDPNVLASGDVLFVPERIRRTERLRTGTRHVFRRRGVPAKVHLRLVENGTPLSLLPYTLDVGGAVKSGQTDGDGFVDEWVAPHTRTVRLSFEYGGAARSFDILLARLEPVETVAGVQARLNNLGFDCGPIDGELNAATVDALRWFQEYIGHTPADGSLDDATRRALANLADHE